MSIESNFKELFSENVTLIPPSSVDKYGRRLVNLSGSVSASAHLKKELRNIREPDGRIVVETGRVYLYGTYTQVTDDWTLLLANGASPVILTVDTPHDQNGAHHTVIAFGETRTG
jgi:hypothetical protein